MFGNVREEEGVHADIGQTNYTQKGLGLNLQLSHCEAATQG